MPTSIPRPPRGSSCSPAACRPSGSATWRRSVGTVQEFSPAQDPASPPTTEIAGGPAVTLLSSGNALPAPVTLTRRRHGPGGRLRPARTARRDARPRAGPARRRPHAERSPSTRPTPLSTTNGVFYGVVDGVPRPFREPGISILDPLPAGAPCCVPRFDENPERLRVDSDGQPGARSARGDGGRAPRQRGRPARLLVPHLDPASGSRDAARPSPGSAAPCRCRCRPRTSSPWGPSTSSASSTTSTIRRWASRS